MERSKLIELAREVKAMPDSFFNEYESMMTAFTEEEKEKVRKCLEPEAERRGLR
jgi:hypothetical protein